ncbi:MAG: hypothetical protein ACI93R_001613 [Flavobacteriales bacterium]|jgi:hypothetical protein
MALVESYKDSCPYCGESIELLVDNSVDEQSYIEDCQVCCRPITVRALVDFSGNVNVSLQHEND